MSSPTMCHVGGWRSKNAARSGPERARTGGNVASRFCRTECVAFAVVDTRNGKNMRPLGEKLRFWGIITDGTGANEKYSIEVVSKIGAPVWWNGRNWRVCFGFEERRGVKTCTIMGCVVQDGDILAFCDLEQRVDRSSKF